MGPLKGSTGSEKKDGSSSKPLRNFNDDIKLTRDVEWQSGGR